MSSNQQPASGLVNLGKPDFLSTINSHFFPEKEVKQVFYYLRGEISIDSCADAIEAIVMSNTPVEYEDEDGELIVEEKPDVINLMITTSGGDMNAAIALINTIRGSGVPVRTIALGEASSAGFCILMAGHQRVVTPFTSLMSHVFSTGVEGTYHDIKNAMEEIHRYNDKMVELYHQFTGVDRKLIKRKFLGHNDAFVSHADALKFNIVDLVEGLQ